MSSGSYPRKLAKCQADKCLASYNYQNRRSDMRVNARFTVPRGKENLQDLEAESRRFDERSIDKDREN